MREPTDQEILDILQEECAEVIHIISKIRRFGMHDTHPYDGECNQSRLRGEILDVNAMVTWLVQREVFPPFLVDERLLTTKKKQAKVRRYLREQPATQL